MSVARGVTNNCTWCGHQPHQAPCNAEIETGNNRQPAHKPCPCTRQRVRNLPHPEPTNQEGQP